MEKNRVVLLGTVVIMFVAALIALIFINNKYQVKFECGKGCKTQIKYVKKGEKVKSIKNPKMDNKVFIEWQLDGKKYNFNKKVNKNLVLKAKWLPEIYVDVYININDGSDMQKISVLAGNTVEKYLKEPILEGYKFVGWYVNDREFDLNKKVTSDLYITAKWERLNGNSYNIGDKVIITGNYASSSYSNYAYHSAAIGWTREIVAIYEGENYPYAVGDKTGVTGYFNNDALKKAN